MRTVIRIHKYISMYPDYCPDKVCVPRKYVKYFIRTEITTVIRTHTQSGQKSGHI